MTKIPEEKIISKGKLGPGQIIAIDLKKGKLFKDQEIKDYLAKDYKKYNKQIIDLEKKVSCEDEKAHFKDEELKKILRKPIKPNNTPISSALSPIVSLSHTGKYIVIRLIIIKTVENSCLEYLKIDT